MLNGGNEYMFLPNDILSFVTLSHLKFHTIPRLTIYSARFVEKRNLLHCSYKGFLHAWIFISSFKIETNTMYDMSLSVYQELSQQPTNLRFTVNETVILASN